MNDWFMWKGENCKDYGIVALGYPSLITPNERVEEVDIPGRSGKLLQIQGDCIYDKLDLSVTCVIENPLDNNGTTKPVRDISGWLRGDGDIVFSTRREGYYRGYNTNQINYSRIVLGSSWHSFSVQWSCEPFFYLFGWDPVTQSSSDFLNYYQNYWKRTWDSSIKDWKYTRLEAQETFVENVYFTRLISFSTSGIASKTFTNKGNIFSQPKIKVEFGTNDNTYVLTQTEPDDFETNYKNYYTKTVSSGVSTYTALTSVQEWAANTYYKAASLTIMLTGGETMLIEDVHELPYLVIDCEAKIAYTGEIDNPTDPLVLRTGRISSGSWMKFGEGANIFSWLWTGSSSIHFTIDPRWRCI